jgi:hypothetical protein
MDISIFTNKSETPTEIHLEAALGKSYLLWVEIREHVLAQDPKLSQEWSYPGPKYGWSFRIKDKKRAIIYLLPRDNYFKVAFVFGQKAMDEIMTSSISSEIKTALSEARVYAEGRGIRIDVSDAAILPDIKALIGIKLRN